jgi:hypothetical protein
LLWNTNTISGNVSIASGHLFPILAAAIPLNFDVLDDEARRKLDKLAVKLYRFQFEIALF